ncbi:plastocyanin/azurin family copper-binding protein [Phragmitibacter flavus]|nr:plastocyanin/azurin family copper-binding protein [Phragmitibacter flavus]
MATHHDTKEQETGGIWKVINLLFGAGFAIFSLVAGTALIYGGIVIRNGGDTAPAKVEAPVAAAGVADPTATVAGGTPVVDVAEILIKPDTVNPMAFDLKTFSVKAGQPVKLTFENKSPVPLPHNWVLGVLGSKDKLIVGANAMMAAPIEKGYIPEIPEVLHHTKLLQPGQTETIEFTAPAEAGDYPYICSFPGHAMLMNGVMKVE